LAYITSFVAFTLLATLLPLLYACAHEMIFNTCSLTRIYRYMCAYLCTSFGTYLATRWGLDCMFRSWSSWILPVADQRCAAKVWIISRPSKALSFQAPACLSSFSLI